MKQDCIYDKEWLIRSLLGLGLMGVAMRFTGGLAFALIYPMILLAFSKNRAELMLYCILMTIAMTMANAAVIPKSFSFGIMARSTYFIVAGVLIFQIIGVRTSRFLSPLLMLLPYIFYMGLVSASGWQPIVSYLKLLLFVVIFLAFYSVAKMASLPQIDGSKLRSIFLSFAIFFIVGSVLLIPFPGLSYLNAAEIQASGGLVEGTMFKGMTLHSQSLGPVVAIVSTLVFADLLFCVQKWDKLYLLLLGCSPILIYMTGSRTAMGTYLAGLCFVTFLFMNARGIGGRWKARAVNTILMLGIFGGLALFSTPQMREAVARFALKYVSEDSELVVDYESVIATRQGSMDMQIANFKASPWIGNGFQVSEGLAEVDYVNWKQLLSAPVEKGVWVTAILEEGGVFGMILFVLFLLVVFPTLFVRQAFLGLSVFFVMIVCNLGEMTIFSMTSTGGLTWAMVFVGLALDAQRIHAQRRARMVSAYSVG